jgi:hypothetical protein
VKVGDLVKLRIAEVNANGDIFKQRHYWGVRDGDLGVVLGDNYGPKATHQLVYFASSKRGVINVKRDDLEKLND